MRDYKDITQRIIEKGDRILAEKQQKKRRIVHIALKASLLCGCLCLCVGTAAMWKLFISPKINDGERYPIVTTQITVTSQVTTNTTAVTTSVTTVGTSKQETTALTERPSEDIEIITTAAPAAEELQTQTAATSAVTVKQTTDVTVPTAVHTQPEPTEPMTTETTVTTYTPWAHNVTYTPSVIEVDGNIYHYDGVYLDQKDMESFYIMWQTQIPLQNVDANIDVDIEYADVFGVAERGNKQEFILVRFPRESIYALYRS